MPPIEWKKISVDDISDKGLISKYTKNSYHSTSKKKKKIRKKCADNIDIFPQRRHTDDLETVHNIIMHKG